MPSSKAEWVNIGLITLAMLGATFGTYGHFTARLTMQDSAISVAKTEREGMRRELESVDNELDVLWVDNTNNKKDIDRNRIEVEKNAKFQEEVLTAVNKLLVSVARVEEKMKHIK